MNDFLCIAGAAVSILMLLGIWGMKDTHKPSQDWIIKLKPPGWKNVKRKKRKAA